MSEDYTKKKFYELLIDNFFGSMLITDDSGKIIFANKGCFDLLRLSPDEVLNKTIYDVVRSSRASGASSIKVLETKKEDISYHTLYGNDDLGILAASKPIFNENNDIDFILTYSFDEKFMYNFLLRFESEKKRLFAALNFIQNMDNDHKNFVAESPAMKSLVSYAKKISKSDSTIIIYGESGSGKDVFARFIHKNSNRANEVFIPINCASIPGELLEAEMFGYEKGAFTDANKEDKMGLFEFANKGTIFLDEIAELPLTLQSKLLRVLETGDVKRLGSNNIVHTDARIITATNRDLSKMVSEGSFRNDLYYRLTVIPIKIPPLRERLEDLEYLSKFFLNMFNKKFGYEKIIKDSLLNQLKSYSWPGNIRELKNIIERMVITSTSNILECEDLTFGPLNTTDYKNTEDTNIDKGYKETMREYEKKYILKVIDCCNGNISEAAKKMNLHISGVYRKLEHYKNS